MNPPTCGDDDFGNLAARGAGKFDEFGRKVMSGLITKVMNPSTCDDAVSGAISGLAAGPFHEDSREVMSGLITKVMNPPTWGFIDAAKCDSTEGPK